MAQEAATGRVGHEETGGVADDLEASRHPLLDTVERFWSWLFLFLLIVVFSVFGHGFLDLFNFQSILANAASAMIMALGLTFVIIAGGIDLSVAYAMGLASVRMSQRSWNFGRSKADCYAIFRVDASP